MKLDYAKPLDFISSGFKIFTCIELTCVIYYLLLAKTVLIFTGRLSEVANC